MRVSSPTVWMNTLPWAGGVTSRPAEYGLPPLLMLIAHQPPSLPIFTATAVSCPAAGVTFGTAQDFAAPAMSAANTREPEPDGRSAQACSSSAVTANASP